jgi:transcription elongation factor GreA
MPIRDLLPPVLRGEAAAQLTPADRAHLEALAHEAQTSKSLAQVRDECAGRLRQPHPAHAVEYLLAAVCALNGEIERAHQTLLALGDKLAAEKQWEPLAAVAERALALEETQAAARLLVKAHEGLGKDPDRIEALERAWVILADDLELGLLVAVRLGEANEGGRRRDLLMELLPRFAEASRFAGLEEAALEFVEHESLEGLEALMQTLPDVAERGALTEAKQLLDIAFPPLAKGQRAGTSDPPLRKVIATAVEKLGPRAAEPFRAALTEALRQGRGRDLPNVDGVIAQSGLADPAVPLPDAIARYDAVAALAPGRAVFHSSFGAGRIVENDGENVFIDFAHARRHRMPHAAALRTLTSIAEDDLRLVKVMQPAELARLKKEEPATLVVRALPALGGSGDATKLKVFLVGSGIVQAAEWTAFWRKARAALEKDPRIDASRAFEQHYRLAPEGAAGGADDGPLPALEPRKSVKTNLATLRKFLAQHPHSEKRVAMRFGRWIERAMRDDNLEAAERARCGLWFARWHPERRAEWMDVLSQLWDQGLSVTDLATEEEQLGLLEIAHAGGAQGDAILSALDSRFSAVREAANRIQSHLDPAGMEQVKRALMDHAARYPQAAIRHLEDRLDGPDPGEDRWVLFFAALTLIENSPRPSVADKVLKWLEPGGRFDETLEGHEPPEAVRLKVRVLLRQWRSSDRYFFPAMEAAERQGFAEDVEIVRLQRQASTDKLFSGVGEQAEDADVPVMTRATWERQQQELERLQHELRTVLPHTIQKARELGDLRENAEYHSAKQKQANVARLVARLANRLLRAKFVEEMEYRDGVIGLGTEVTLEGDGDVASYWILGEGEHHHGEHVVSFQTPVGRALMGHAIGDEVEIGEAGKRRKYRVVSIERKLPAAGSEAHS